MSGFDSQERILMFPESTLNAFNMFKARHGVELPIMPRQPQGRPNATVICAKLDREGSNDLRPCVFSVGNSDPLDNTNEGEQLTNGQYAYKAYWSQSLVDTVLAGSPNAVFITKQEWELLKQDQPEL